MTGSTVKAGLVVVYATQGLPVYYYPIARCYGDLGKIVIFVPNHF